MIGTSVGSSITRLTGDLWRNPSRGPRLASSQRIWFAAGVWGVTEAAFGAAFLAESERGFATATGWPEPGSRRWDEREAGAPRPGPIDRLPVDSAPLPRQSDTSEAARPGGPGPWPSSTRQ